MTALLVHDARAKYSSGIFSDVEQLGFLDTAIEHIVLDQLPIPFLNASHAGFGAAVVNTVQDISDHRLFAFKDRFKAESFIGLGSFNASQVTKRCEYIE